MGGSPAAALKRRRLSSTNSRTAGASSSSASEAHAAGLDLALPPRQAFGPRVGIRGNRREPRDQRLELHQLGVLGSQPLVQLGQAVAEDAREGARSQGQHRVVVPHAEAALVEHQPQLPGVEHRAVLIAQDRQQHLAGQLGLDRIPFDVEMNRRGRRRSLLQHVEPARVAIARDAHVVGHQVDQQAEPALPQRRGQATEGRLASQLGPQPVVVVDVVAVAAGGGGLEERRGVAVTHAEVLEVGQRARRRRRT